MSKRVVESGPVLVTGGTGFIGRHLCGCLLERGFSVWVLSRNPQAAIRVLDERVKIVGSLDELGEIHFSAVINLAGQSLASARWNAESKQEFYASRVDFTEALFDFFKRSDRFPDVLLNASAIGFYGDCGDRVIDEQTPAGQDYAADLCSAWEGSAQRFEAHGVRVCKLRIGIVLERDGGALKQMLPAFRLGLGGRLGSGQHYTSWIHRKDLLRLFLFLLDHGAAQGVVNAVAPEPVTNRYFTSALAEALHRPAPLPMPAAVLRVLFGEMADVLLLSSQRVVPASAFALGFEFEYPELKQAFATIFNN